MTITQQQAQLIAKLRYQGKQYAAGQVARGGAGQKHYLEEAADELEMMALALSMEKVTPQSARENADLRNVIQAACIDGLPGLARAWEKYFPDHPISIKGIEQGAGADVQIVPAGTLVHMQGLPFNLKSDALMEGANFHLLEKQTPSVEGAATVQSTYEAVERQSGETGELYQTATSDDALQALIYASKVYRAHGIPTDGIEATITRLQGQQPEPEYNPLLIDGVEHDPLCLKVYRSPLKECDCGAQAAQAPVQPQAVVPAPPQEFESAQGRALASAWGEGWAQCRDAEFIGEDAQDEAFNQSVTLAQCLHADQTRFQGGLSNDQLRRAWSAKVPNVIPTDEQLTAFALGIEAAAQPSAQAEQAPVVQAVQADDFDEHWVPLTDADRQRAFESMPDMLDGFLKTWGWLHFANAIEEICREKNADRASSGATPADVRMLTDAEQTAIIDMHNTGREQGAHECVEDIQRKFCAVNAGKRIPASGVIGAKSPLICPRCKVDRLKDDCPGPRDSCPIKFDAQSGGAA